ncbi:MAG: PadR family transcriptional regulator [Eubacteriales bacterium]|nr:PadR family transcriptional regulator [Eubacteriales bacterium]
MDLTSDLIRGHIDTIILSFLKDKDMYGYEIGKTVLTKSDGKYELKEPSMYSTIRRLEKGGLIAAYWGDETQGARRKYYRITAHGHKVLAQNLSNWAFAKKIIDQLLEV